MSDEWFTCEPCGIEFQDPWAPVEGTTVYGRCPECGHTYSRPTSEEFERRMAERQKLNLTEVDEQ